MLLYACNTNNQPEPNNPPPPPADPTELYATFTYTMNGQTFTRVETKRNYTTAAWDIEDSFDRVVAIFCGDDFTAGFAIPTLRSGSAIFDTMSMVKPIKGNGNYTTHMAMNCSIKTPDTLFFPMLGDDDPRPGHLVTYTSIQDIGDLTDSVYMWKGPYPHSYFYETWDVWEASGTFTDTVQGSITLSDGSRVEVDKTYPVSGSFTVRFLTKQ